MKIKDLQIYNLIEDGIGVSNVTKLYNKGINLFNIDEEKVNDTLTGKGREEVLNILKRNLINKNKVSCSILIPLGYEKINTIKKLIDNDIDFIQLYFYSREDKLDELVKLNSNIREELMVLLKNIDLTFNNVLSYVNVEHLQDEIIINSLIKQYDKRIRKLKTFDLTMFLDLFPKKLDKQISSILLGNLLVRKILVINEEHKLAFNEISSTEQVLRLSEVIKKISNEKHREIFELRLAGLTYDEIGEKYGFSRQRGQQVCSELIKELIKMPILENKYLNLLNYYNVNFEDFNYLFGEPIEVYNYLKEIKDNNVYLDDNYLALITSDQNIDVNLRKRAEDLLHRHEIMIDGEYVEKSRNKIIDFAIKKYAVENIHFEDLYNKVNKLKLPADLQFDNLRAFKGMTERSNFLLQGFKYVRYYDFSQINIDELCANIGFYDYKDCIISSLLIYRKHEAYLKDLDIRNHYELYDILKRFIGDTDEIDFVRNPNINYGYVDAKSFFDDYMTRKSPITKEDLFKQVNQDLGWSEDYVKANYLGDYETYLDNGIYNVFPHKLSEENISILNTKLNKNLYTTDDFEKVMQDVLGKDFFRFNNNYNIKKIGFKRYSKFYLSTKYKDVKTYFDSIIDDNDEPFSLKFDDNDQNVVSNTTFSGLISQKNKKKELFEYNLDNHLYVSLKGLEKLGISENDLNNFIETLNTMELPNFFTIDYLRKHLNDNILKVNDDLLNSIVESNNKLYRQDYADFVLFTTNHKFSNAMLVEAIKQVLENGMKIDELLLSLDEKYGTTIKKEALKKYLDKANFYVHSNKVYLNKKAYLNSKLAECEIDN